METAEGKILCLALSLYGYGLFGHVTAMLASYFVGQDVHAFKDVHSLKQDLRALKKEKPQEGES